MAAIKCNHVDRFEEVPIPNEAFAHRLFQSAVEYLSAGKALHVGSDDKWRPKYFVLCHAIELFLKAHLAARGLTSNLRRDRLGHCLICLWNNATSNGLSVDIKNVDILIGHIFDYTELVRYPDLVIRQRVTASNILDLCDKLREAVQEANRIALISGALTGGYQVVELWHDRGSSGRES